MAFLTADEINTHLYGEVTDEINRGTATLLESAIKAAIAEARGYLTAYDLAAIFNATEDERNPILLLYIKDIAVWHYIQLANPGLEMELREKRYDNAIHWFEKVQSGKTNPDLPLPVVPENSTSGSAENFLKWGSNTKRSSHY